MEYIMYLIISGWSLSILFSLLIICVSFYNRDFSNFEFGWMALVISVLIGWILFYPVIAAMIIYQRFN